MTQVFHRLDTLPITQPTVSKALKRNCKKQFVCRISNVWQFHMLHYQYFISQTTMLWTTMHPVHFLLSLSKSEDLYIRTTLCTMMHMHMNNSYRFVSVFDLWPVCMCLKSHFCILCLCMHLLFLANCASYA